MRECSAETRPIRYSRMGLCTFEGVTGLCRTGGLVLGLALWWSVGLVMLSLGSLPVLAGEATHGTIESHAGVPTEQWEGSATAKAYSERNHHVAGLIVLLIGFSELRVAWGVSSTWMRGLLPVALLGVGMALVIWSDHDAWPIGQLGFVETFLGGDREILQHKAVAFALLLIGVIEWGRRIRWMPGKAWAYALPCVAVAGGLLLLLHDHGHHPGAHAIAMHHARMGTLACLAGAAKLLALWDDHAVGTKADIRSPAERFSRPYAAAWGGCVMMIGLLLLAYQE